MRVHESITLPPPPTPQATWVPIPDICRWLTQNVPVSSPAEALWPSGLAAGGCCPLAAEPMPHLGMGRHVLKRAVLGSLGLGCGCRAVAGTPACQLHQLCTSTRALRITQEEAWRVGVPWASECMWDQGSRLAIRATSSAFPLGPGGTTQGPVCLRGQPAGEAFGTLMPRLQPHPRFPVHGVHG